MTSENARPCLLIVDDDSTVQEMLRACLDSRYKMVSLPSGEGILKAIEDVRPRLLVLDVNLPGSDGHKICEAVRDEAKLLRLPVLFMTVRRDNATYLKSLQSGGNALILKPFEIAAFREQVEYLLKSSA